MSSTHQKLNITSGPLAGKNVILPTSKGKVKLKVSPKNVNRIIKSPVSAKSANRIEEPK